MAREGQLAGDALGLEEMEAVFQGCPAELLADHVDAVVRRRFAPGEIVCREGEPGSTAFLLLDGEAEIFLSAPIMHLEDRHRPRGLFGAITQFRPEPVRRTAADAGARRRIPVDAPTELSQEKPTATLRAGDLFGEMTCLSAYPRSATVRARTDLEALEMRRDLLDALKCRSREFQARIERNYKARALVSHLRDVPIFRGLSDAFRDGLRERVELVRYEPGQVICTQGDDTARLRLIRIGFVKMSRAHARGEVVLRYLHRGEAFGEMGLLGAGRCPTTCVAIDHVELGEIRREDFDRLVDEFPAIRAELESVVRKQTERKTPVGTGRDSFLVQGVMEAQDLLLIDLDRCTRCDECVRACAASHEGVTRLIRDGLRFHDRYLMPTSCRACHDPLCMIGCPVGALRRTEALEVLVEDWCIGCGLCVGSCPYGHLNLHRAGENGRAAKAIRCDLCAELKEPVCVYACPHEAALRVAPATVAPARETR